MQPEPDRLRQLADAGFELALLPSELEDSEISLFGVDRGESFALPVGDLDLDRQHPTTQIQGSVAGHLLGLMLTGSKARQAAQEASRFSDVVASVSPRRVPSPAWFLQAQRNATERQELLEEFGALESDQLADLAGSQARNRRATAHRWQESGQVFSVPSQGRAIFPGFQFSAETGHPKPAVRDVLRALPDAMQGWELALWWTTPIDLLDWRRPVDLLDSDQTSVVTAALDEASQWNPVEAVTS